MKVIRYGVLFVSFLLGGCIGLEKSPTASAILARNQMMLVRQQPPTFGYYRLTTLASNYPHLGSFLGKRGSPDFLAETSSGGRSYFILYYLPKRQAFVSRTLAEEAHSLEFAGPYPISSKEYQMLSSFQKNAAR